MKPGTVGWIDLTVDDADGIRDFYAAVVGWKPEPVAMGDYSDYNMTNEGTPVAGVCHKRGPNADLPSVWMPYFVVADIEAALAEARKRGAEVLREPQGQMKFGVIRDPAGANCALFEAPQV